ncbi:ankyrin repeat-containing domain protein [Xylaria grammica]|nr:ankyrin repeat-containing domain protein [Xylaria grammica]
MEMEDSNRDSYQFSTPPFVSNLCQRLLADTDYKGRTAIHFTARMNRVRHARLLLWYGVNVDHPDAVGRTPLHIALYWNHHEFIRLPLEQGARFDVADDNKMSVLHYVALYSDEETLKLLSDAKMHFVGPNCRDAQGHTPLDTFENVRPSIMSESVSASQRSRALFVTLLHDAAS